MLVLARRQRQRRLVHTRCLCASQYFGEELWGIAIQEAFLMIHIYIKMWLNQRDSGGTEQASYINEPRTLK